MDFPGSNCFRGAPSSYGTMGGMGMPPTRGCGAGGGGNCGGGGGCGGGGCGGSCGGSCGSCGGCGGGCGSCGVGTASPGLSLSSSSGVLGGTFNGGRLPSGGFGMSGTCGAQGLPSSYNPSGEILAMINKGHDHRQNLGLGAGKGLGVGGALPQGMSQGMAQGMAQGLQQGMAQGLQQGMAQGMAQGMSQGGLPQGLAQGVLSPSTLGGVHPQNLSMGSMGSDLGSAVGSSFDVSDFPSLSHRSAMGANLSSLRSAQPHGALGQQSEFAILSEDFPALPGAAPASAGYGGMLRSDNDAIGKSTDNGGRADRFGLMGILSVIRMTDQDLNTLALGTDLTTLGLNLNSSDCLYATFASPWADAPAQCDPEFNLPQCYYMQPPALKTSHFSKLQLETLFYIFYNMPRDTLQAYAATELYNRDWRYHKELTLWFTRAGRHGGDESAKGQYIYFDIHEWKKKVFYGAGQSGDDKEGADDKENADEAGGHEAA